MGATLNRGASKQEKFWARVDRRSSSECWPWLKGRSNGYGNVYLGGGRVSPQYDYAHRQALIYTTNAVGDVAMHKCDNRLCCNPNHLKWASHQENSQDALSKGRQYIGEQNSNAKLTVDTVKQVRLLRKAGHTYREIELITGVKKSNSSMIACGRSWKHVNA